MSDFINYSLLRTSNLTKRFGKVLANDDISLDIRPGEIHCLLGENGAGKSTLAECLFGYFHPDSGDILFNEKKVTLSSPSDAIRLGIGMVHQHFVLVRPLSVVENIIVGTDAAKTILDLSAANRQIQKLCSAYDLCLDLSAKIWQLSVGEQQWVEILKALFGGVNLLILDEPTAVLTPQEVEKLFAILRQMRSEGMAVVFITHILREVIDISDRVTVLRRGRKVATVDTKDVTREDLARMMVGRDVVFRVEKPEVRIGEPVLEVERVCTLNDRGREALCGISLSVRAGETVGVAGVSGNGQKELFECIVGVRHAESGRVLLEGKDITNKSPHEIASVGMAHIPEDRLVEGLVPGFSVAENLILGLHNEQFFDFNGGWLNLKEVESFATKCIKDFDIITPSAKQPTLTLSGGNIQKVIIARELSGQPKCLIVNQPTRGLDVGAIEYVHNRLLKQREQGTGILLFSEDLDEILTLSDRILVVFKGFVIGELDAATASREQIGLLMAGSVEEGR